MVLRTILSAEKLNVSPDTYPPKLDASSGALSCPAVIDFRLSIANVIQGGF